MRRRRQCAQRQAAEQYRASARYIDSEREQRMQRRCFIGVTDMVNGSVTTIQTDRT
jgi:hypothetical protein